MDPNLLKEIHSATNTLSKVQKINPDDVELKEELYIGNLHHQSRHHRNNHCWTMFISKSPTDVVPPITVKCVTYHLHQTFRPNIVTIHEPPFYLARRGWGYFTVKADITFKSEYYPSSTDSKLHQKDPNHSSNDQKSNNNDSSLIQESFDGNHYYESGVTHYINPNRQNKKKKKKKIDIKGLTTIRAVHSIHFGCPIATHHVKTMLPYLIDSPALLVECVYVFHVFVLLSCTYYDSDFF